MINKLHYLRFTSGIALICDIYFLSVVFYNFYQNVINNPSWNSDDVYLYYNPNLISIFLGFPIIAFAYTFRYYFFNFIYLLFFLFIILFCSIIIIIIIII